MFGRVASVFSIFLLMGCVGTTPNVRFDPNSTTGVGKTRFVRAVDGPQSSAPNTRNCADFSSAFAAQRFFQSQGGPSNDPHDLDRDGDGYACEWGVELKRQETARREAARRRYAAASRCYTGPRGGTYTITASGNKNYSGC